MNLGGAERVVLVHDWLTGMRGGEKCLEPACRRWPDAPLFTLLHRRGSVSETIEQLAPHASLLNRLPGVGRYYRYLLPAMPLAARWRIPDCDVVLSFSHCVAKAANPPPGVPHICYCFTPMRYAWHLRESYFRRGHLGKLKTTAIDLLLARLRRWDQRTADRVTHFVAISETIRRRIRDCYDRDSVVIYPPVDTEFYCPAALPREDYYLIVSALAPYKRFDLAIEACKQLRKKLVIIGTGQDAAKLRTLAGPDAAFLGWQPDEVVRDHLRRCRALLFPGEEDFGIVPVEAQACGAPVIALGRGGVTETVRPLGTATEPTGVYFHEQTVEAVSDAILRFEREADAFDPRAARRNALPFRQERYEAELFGYVETVLRGDTGGTRQAA
jgi:glycosyltransferase involved in cell wall biosynthesis